MIERGTSLSKGLHLQQYLPLPAKHLHTILHQYISFTTKQSLTTSKMVRGEGQVNKVHYKGKEDDFIVMVEDVAEYNKWKGDKSIPLVEVVSGFKIFVTHK